jgi:transcriptional regulator with XRE-family HTH domain
MPAPRRRRAERLPQYEGAVYRALLRRFTVRLRALRDERGWTQEEAGARCEMAMQQYQRIEAGRVNLTFTTLARLCEGFGVDACTLLSPIADEPAEGPG